MNLSSTIKSIQDIMRKDDGVDGDAQRIGQLTWMLFLKVFDQREEEWETAAISKKAYKSPLPEECRWRNWASYVVGADGKKKPQINSNELIDFVKNHLFPKLKNLEIEGNPIRKVIRQVFEDSNVYMKSGTLMLGVIEKLNEAINFHDFTTRKNLGDIYEQLLNDLRAAGNAGEFYTPRAITNVMVKLVNPRLDKQETIMDPACGTGGFLTAAIDHLQQQLIQPIKPSQRKILEKSIYGIEKKQLPHLLCTTNLLLHGIDVPSQIDHDNTLARPWASWDSSKQVTCVITNPPFGGLEDGGVGSDYPTEFRTRETADMFLTLIIKKILKHNGRGAVVLPDGALFGEGVKSKIKKLLLEECNLHTIIRLPNGVFAPYTNIKSNILFFTKGEPTQDIWFYEHPYPEGQKSYSKTKPILEAEFETEKAWWGEEQNNFSDRVESAQAWKFDFKTKEQEARSLAQPYWINAKEISEQINELEKQVRILRDTIKSWKEPNKPKDLVKESNQLRAKIDLLRVQGKEAQLNGDRLYWPVYNLDLKNPNSIEAEAQDAEVLLGQYKDLLSNLEKVQNQLKNELGMALAYHFENKLD